MVEAFLSVCAVYFTWKALINAMCLVLDTRGMGMRVAHLLALLLNSVMAVFAWMAAAT